MCDNLTSLIKKLQGLVFEGTIDNEPGMFEMIKREMFRSIEFGIEKDYLRIFY